MQSQLNLEKAYLAALISGYEPEQYLLPEVFTEPMHSEIFNIIKELTIAGLKVDVISVTVKAPDNFKAEIETYFKELLEIDINIENIGTYTTLLKENAMKRKIKTSVIKISEKVDKMDITTEELKEDVQKLLFEMYKSIDKPILSLSEIINAELLNAKHKTHYISTPFNQLNDLIGGWNKGELTVVGARPGMGKTAFFANLALHAALVRNIPVGIIDLENSKRIYALRCVSIISGCEFPSLIHKKISISEETAEMLEKAPLYFEDNNLMLSEILYKIRQLNKMHGVELFFIDNMQMITPDLKDLRVYRERQIGIIMQEIRKLARELQVSIVMSSNLSRAVETRGGDKKPQLSDLRESGSIEQDSDKVIFLYRPAYYGFTEDACTGESIVNEMEVILAKNKTGYMGSARLHYDPKTGKISEPATDEKNNNSYLNIREEEFPF